MKLLEQDDILRVHAAAMSAGLSRAALLAGINHFYLAVTPTVDTPERQVVADLDALNDAGKLSDGTVPLAIWLENAGLLTGARGQAEVFRAAAETCRSAAVHVEPVAARTSWGSDPSVVLQSWRKITLAIGGMLDDGELLKVLDAATTSGLMVGGYRDALLGGLPLTILKDIPRGDTCLDQMALDLGVLNQRRLVGWPLLRWLTNASVLCRMKREQVAFAEAVVCLTTRMTIDELDTGRNPPLATTVEDLIQLIATLYAQGARQAIWTGIDISGIAGVSYQPSELAQAHWEFYKLHAAMPSPGAEAPFLMWLRNLRLVAKLSSTDPVSQKALALEAEYTRFRRS